MMFRWIPFPFLRYLIVLAGGIAIGIWTGYAPPLWAPLGIFGLYVSMVFIIPGKNFLRKGIVLGANALLGLFVAGMVLVDLHKAGNNPNHYIHLDTKPDYYTARVMATPVEKGKYSRTEVALENGIWKDSTGPLKKQPVSGNVILYYTTDEQTAEFGYRDLVLVKGKLREVEGPANPRVFDYKQFLAYRNIYQQHFTERGGVKLLEPFAGHSIIGTALALRKACREMLAQYIANPEARSVALALTLGIKDQMDRSLQEAFAAAGAMHVLAVSGLHVGIIYGIIYLALFPLFRMKGGQFIHGILSVLLLWFYALLTGLSPSVLRAVTMFTFVIFARISGRQQGIFNTIALSAFILLCINPFFLMQVGFQLSYLAVFGIVLLYPYITQWMNPSNTLLKRIWQLSAVSIAAQIATFPIAIYYFHQLPVYFLLTNLLVIPAASVILSLGLGTLMLGFVFPLLAQITGWLLTQGINGLIYLVYLEEGLPGSTLTGMVVSGWQVFLFYLFIGMLIMLFLKRKFQYAGWATIFLTLIMLKEVHDVYQSKRQDKLVFYKVNNRSVTGLVRGRSASILLQKPAPLSEKDFAFNVEPSLIHWGAAGKMEIKKISDFGKTESPFSLLQWQGQRIIYIYSRLKPDFSLETPMSCNMVVIGNNAIRDLAIVKNNFKPGELILDSSNDFYRARELEKQAKDFNMACHNILEDGGKVINL